MPHDSLTGRVLVLGGARSGKSTHAEGLLAGPGPVDYLATSQRVPGDAEWDARIAKHRARRPAHWTTIETIDVASELVRHTDRPLLVDCLTVWLTRQMDEAGVWDGGPGTDERLAAATDELVAAFTAARRPVVAVSNEVGQGIVPSAPSVRRFRDEMGVLNMRVAAAVDEVWFCVAGLPQRLK
ncbi:bifunctional adenosylcobinamide kinase/adenosylcobinamide-phosphate guanylyltransferase [Brooklawnia cerclae]|uniref:Adenosylcobinamide kinase n=1 Tax=Brooklawnia cerclae TaxID=349934 RepID=A0ABX0SH06_9ACTN|nr:bifunctional adenosylcobinamide kinase/adenosylcobinamide-phosphate guanylyltransferase [Brooklawnia cerclae]NIH57624.1 adenosylcobinamide kinase/adenosylcobinamide-phosphate guanylyltransferase [Brooklawnia cerclae]